MDNAILHLSLHVILQGLIFSFVAMGVFLSSRIIRFDDLTTEGSFGCGGAVTALLASMSPWVTLPMAMLAGALAGIATGLLHTRWKINNLISGLAVTTGLFSICLKMAGSNSVLPEHRILFGDIPQKLLVLGGLAGACFLGLKMLLRSEIGLLLKASGTNPQMVTSLGRDADCFKIAGLAMANSLTALAGCLFVHWNGFFSITGNIGILVTGLAGVILGEVIRPALFSIILGAILYQALFTLTIEIGLDPVWNNLIKAALMVLFIQLKPKSEVKPCCV